MSQSKLGSLVEALTHVFIGYFLSLAVQFIVYPLYGASFSIQQNIEIGLIFMIVSLIRGYVIRRWFNDSIHRAAMKITKDNSHG
jgi:hypothetical protein